MGAEGGMLGSTVVLLLVHGRHFAVLWAGDSRAYRFDGAIACLTLDHSLVQELISRGELDSADAEYHLLANVVTRAVGADDDLVLDAVQGEIREGDLLLLCSDGLTKHLADADIAALLREGPVREMADRLVEATLARGGSDNVSVVVVRCAAAPPGDDAQAVRTAVGR
jgi:serine/threonine protein phosphatase PrpC